MQRRTSLLAIALLISTPGICVAQSRPSSAPSQSATAKLQGLDALADQAMKQWKVPGLAIAVVQDGRVIYAKGYGYRDLENKLPVTTATLFPIGSITKSFTALTFAILKQEGKVDWDQPVRNYLPEFQMQDPVVTEQATPRDLFSHHTGLPRHDLVWYSSDFSREDMVGRLRYLKPNKGFRSAYQYNNLTIMTMGYLEGKFQASGGRAASARRFLRLWECPIRTCPSRRLRIRKIMVCPTN